MTGKLATCCGKMLIGAVHTVRQGVITRHDKAGDACHDDATMKTFFFFAGEKVSNANTRNGRGRVAQLAINE